MCLEVGDMTIYFTITVSHIGYFCCFVLFGAFIFILNKNKVSNYNQKLGNNIISGTVGLSNGSNQIRNTTEME